MADLQISNVVNISVAATPAGIGSYNTSNIGLFTTETPSPVFTDPYKIYLEPSQVGVDFGTSSITYKMALGVFSQSPNILAAGGYLAVIPLLTSGSETTDAAVTRTKDLIQYFGIMTTRIETQSPLLSAAATIQALNKLAFFVQKASTSVDTGGVLDLLRTGTLTKSRGLYYGASADLDALVMQASYAGRALSTNFSGSNTTTTMHLKDLIGVQPDPSMTQTIYAKAKAAGADVYGSVQGVPKVLTSGANKFFDQMYNLGWFVGALQVNGFNYLATTSTKITQTEQGMDGLKGAYRQICAAAVTNAYSAPGKWTSPTTFGNQQDLLDNVTQFGYYIYSTPISTQLQADREARVAPLIQIALKEAGALHSSTVIVNVNA